MGHNITRRTALATVAASSALVAGCASDDNGDDDDSLTFAGGGEGGAWSLGAATWSEFASEEFDASVTSRDGGGEANIIDVSEGDVDIAWTYSNTIHEAVAGEGDFPQEFDDVRAIAAVWPAPVMSLATPDIESYEDLEGQSFAPGEVGMSGYAAALTILEQYGLDEDDVDIVESGYGEMASLYQDGLLC